MAIITFYICIHGNYGKGHNYIVLLVCLCVRMYVFVCCVVRVCMYVAICV